MNRKELDDMEKDLQVRKKADKTQIREIREIANLWYHKGGGKQTFSDPKTKEVCLTTIVEFIANAGQLTIFDHKVTDKEPVEK